jgi:galactose mutarotase-like enzyme
MSPVSHQTYLLALADCRAEVVPERGALLTRLSVGGRDLLYLDHDTLADRDKNVRGGVPLLFPFAGKLPGDQFEGLPVKQHGFGRNLAWNVVEEVPGLLRMALESSERTRSQWRWDFRAEHTIRLSPRGASIELVVENRSQEAMPCAPGWHPYFGCPLGQKRELGVDVAGFDRASLSEDREFDFGLPLPVRGRVTCELPFVGKFLLEASPRMRHLQLWSQPGKPFVCIEPFWGPTGVIQTPERDLIPPGRAHDYYMRIELVA